MNTTTTGPDTRAMTPGELQALLLVLGDGGKPIPLRIVAQRLDRSTRQLIRYKAGEQEIPRLVARELRRWVQEVAEGGET